MSWRSADTGDTGDHTLGPPARCPFTVSFLGEDSPTKIVYRKKGSLILASLLEDLVMICGVFGLFLFFRGSSPGVVDGKC